MSTNQPALPSWKAGLYRLPDPNSPRAVWAWDGVGGGGDRGAGVDGGGATVLQGSGYW